jgi:hypothetical protein
VGDESLRWNTLLPSLLVLSEQLEEFSLVYANNDVIVIEPEEVEHVST